jgi:hypothetical protein
MPEFFISISLMACVFLSTTAILSIRSYSLLCSVYANRFFSSSPSHSSVNRSVRQSPLHCQTISPFIWPSINRSHYLCPSVNHQSIRLSIHRPSVNRLVDPTVKSKAFSPSLFYSLHRPKYNTSNSKVKTQQYLKLSRKMYLMQSIIFSYSVF